MISKFLLGFLYGVLLLSIVFIPTMAVILWPAAAMASLGGAVVVFCGVMFAIQ